MASLFPISVRLPIDLNVSLNTYAAKNNLTKSDVLIAALAKYLGEESVLATPQRLAEIEKQISALQEDVNNLKSSKS